MKKTSSIDEVEVAKFSQLAAHWWDKDGPLKTLHDINPARLQLMSNYLNFSQRTVLDVGCGGGILAEAMVRCGAKVTGLDVDADIIQVAKQHAALEHLTLEYHCSPIESFKAKRFDVVTCMEMLEHVADPQLVIKHCARLLNRGGYLFLSTINRTWKAYAAVILAAEYFLRLLPRQTHDYDKFIKPHELASIVRLAGLETVELTGLSYNPVTRVASLVDDVQINYLMVCKKP